MAGKKEKTISGAMYSAPNLEHNLRTHIPPNSVEWRRYRNVVYSRDEDITLLQVYQKVFAESYKMWRDREIQKGRGNRFPETYYEKIEQDKQKKLCYEIIWQIGDMRDTGFRYEPEDAQRAQELLREFANYLLALPEVCVVTQKELDDPDWKPPFEAGLIVHHMVYHGDENSPHIHMTYIPYTTHSTRGATIQNAFAQTFKDLGYPTTMSQAVTESGKLVWQHDEDGNLKPQMKRDSYGGADWVEKQKATLQEMMLEKFGWERFYKGSNPRGNLQLSDYRREKAAKTAKEEERKLEAIEAKITTGQETLQNQTVQVERVLGVLQEGLDAEKRLSSRISERKAELEEAVVNLTNKKNEVRQHEQELDDIKAETERLVDRAKFAEALEKYVERMNTTDREYAYYEKILDLEYENQSLRYDKKKLEKEKRTLEVKLEQAYDYMKQFTISGVNMLEAFLKSVGGWVQEKVAGWSR